MKKRLSRKSGMTLIEALIAAAMLALVVAGGLGVVQAGVFISVQSTRAMIADVAAQQLVEELAGRNQAQIIAWFSDPLSSYTGVYDPATGVVTGTDGDVNFTLTITFGVDFDGVIYNDLARVIVNAGGQTLEAILNVG